MAGHQEILNTSMVMDQATLRFKEQSTKSIAEFPDFYHLEPFPRLREIRRHLFTMLNSVEKYNRFAESSFTDFDGSSTDPLSGIVVSFQDLTAAEPRMVYILVAFTWLSESPIISGPVRIRQDVCKTKYKMSPSSVRSDGEEAAAGYCLNSVSYRVDEAVKYNVLNSD